MSVVTKQCTRCGERKTLDLFFANKKSSDGRMASCKACKTAAVYAWRDKNREHLNEYQREYVTRQHAQERIRAYRALPATREKAREQMARRRQTEEYRKMASERERSAKVVAYRKAYKQRPERQERTRELARRDHVRTRHRRDQQRYRATASGNIHGRMSCAINAMIKKKNRSWVSLVGYSLSELMTHLERQFLPGMTWDNFGDWHIDHIVPKSAFHFESADDDDFKACWGLGNLRPLWARDNITKSDKRLFLI